ncbi:DUF4465 domain-containing protein [Aeoliella sp. ICT_H6.2]|uniref:DUF4465 domain-containing protein n=1 Tax=Aeoliella straminimaris TaxID=2954799 RepID=A0A9X2FG77_9BACT|nr:DUF4465 domain-containing protein [Aeoliella straminimaris]MCO6045784.1 DUF4465 domain-containing protein [Aeoliella straminimaris]
MTRRDWTYHVGLLLLAFGGTVTSAGAATVVDFEELSLAGTEYEDGRNLDGSFESQGALFSNNYEAFTADCCWEGFAYSRAVDTTTAGPMNQYSAFAGSGADGSSQFAVAYSGYDAGNGGAIPAISLPAGAHPLSIEVTNTTYAALSMRDGDSFAKKFGGISGNEADWFQLRIEGWSDADVLLGEVEFYLADFRSADNSQDYIVQDWTSVDLSPLAQDGVARLEFRLDSSDIHPQFGMNTPAYVAIDNLVLGQSQAGDYNGDGLVNLADYAVWRNHLGTSVPAGSGADGDGSGTVGVGDYGIWKNHFGEGGLATAIQLAVPEPPSKAMWICILGLGLGICLKRTRN